MALIILFGLVALACMRGLVQWRDGLFGIVVIAAVQDPLRKLIPGTPGYLALAVIPVLGAALLALMVSESSWRHAMLGRFPALGRAMGWFILACVPAAFLSATYGPGSWMLTIFGASSYGVMLAAMFLGFHFPKSIQDLRRFLGFYCLVMSVMLIGGAIQYLDLWPGSLAVGTGALGSEWIRHKPGVQIELISGFFRSPDVMGWHAATTVMFAAILSLTARGKARGFWFLLGAMAFVALVLCGRRKMAYMLPIFGTILIWLYWQASAKVRVSGFLMGLAIPVGIGMVLAEGLGVGKDSDVGRYYTEGSAEVLDRLEAHGIQTVLITYDQSGFMGLGLGTATPGSQHLAVARPRTWQEGAASRIMVELGVPGFIAFGALVFAILVTAWRVTLRQVRARSPASGYAAGFLAFFLANVGSLVVSGQILADAAIATVIGLTVGFVLSLEREPVTSDAKRARAKPASPRLVLAAAGGPSRFPSTYANARGRIPGGSARR